MSNSEPDEWPASAISLRSAVFAQPYSQERRAEIERELLGYQWVDGEHIEELTKIPNGFALTRSTIDWEYGEFEFYWENSSDPTNCGKLRLFPPYCDFREGGELPSDNRNRKILPDTFAELLADLAWLQWEGMAWDFNERLRLGHYVLRGRPQSPLAPIVTIPRDVWPNFKVEHWPLGTAICEASGDRLFSLHVVEGTGGPQQTQRRAPGEPDYQAFLDEALRCAAKGAPMTRQQSESWAKTRGFSRNFARDARRRLDEASKLRPGQKRADLDRIL